MINNKSISMVRLNYTLPEWTRMMWSSEEIRIKWEHRIQAASVAWLETEERSVEMGIRSSALLFVDDAAFLEKSKHYARKGLVLQPLQKHTKTNHYSSSGTGYEPGTPFSYRVVLTTPELVPSWIAAWEAGEDRKIGELLGFPPCCIDFFKNVWIDDHYLDTTWPMYQNSETPIWQANILLRWMGIRAVSHLPCSQHCPQTVEQAEINLQLMDDLGFSQQATDIENLLNLPIEWSAKHGIAEIKTPLFKISTRTDATAELYVVQVPGRFYPAEAPSGNKFPYLNEQQNLLSLSKSFKRSLEAVDVSLEWQDNGFTSRNAMDTAHSQLVDGIVALMDSKLTPDNSIIDLGCGNGKLLELLELKFPHMLFSGVENNFDRARRAQFRNPSFEILNHDIFDETKYSQRYGVGIISINRVFEAGLATKTWETLTRICKNLIVYSYDSPDVVSAQVRQGNMAIPLDTLILGHNVRLLNWRK
jgi:hypothetical protein